MGTTFNSWRSGHPDLTFKEKLMLKLRPEKEKESAMGRAEGAAGVHQIGALGYKEQKTQLHKPQGHCIISWQGI